MSRLRETCPACGARADEPDKGLGRARMAAWRSRHQHPEETPLGRRLREALLPDADLDQRDATRDIPSGGAA